MNDLPPGLTPADLATGTPDQQSQDVSAPAPFMTGTGALSPSLGTNPASTSVVTPVAPQPIGNQDLPPGLTMADLGQQPASPQVTPPSPTGEPQQQAAPHSFLHGAAMLAPEIAAYEYLTKQQTMPAAFAHGMISGTTGNLSDWFKETAASGFNALTGRGPTAEQQHQSDEAYKKALEEKYGGTTLGGQLAGLTMLGVGTGVAANAAAATLGVNPVAWSMPARIAWQGLQGAGIGAWLGFAGGNGPRDRATQAGEQAILGGALGLVGGAIGEGINAGVTKMFGEPISPQAKAAAKAVGLNPSLPSASQQPEIAEALNKVMPVQKLTPEATTGLNQDIQQGVSSRLGEMKSTALDYLHSAASRNARLSADAVGNVGQEVTRSLEQQGITLTRNIDPYSAGAQAINILKELGENAASAPNGQVDLMAIEGAHQQINALKPINLRDKAVVSTIQHAYDKWLGNAIDSHLISGDPEAYAELLKFRQGYSEFKSYINPKTALGNIYNHALNGDQISNWFNNVTNLGSGEKGKVLADDLKGLLRDNSQAWQDLRNLTFSKFVTPAAGRVAEFKALNIAGGLDKLLAAPVSRSLYSPAELQTFRTLSDGFKAIPANILRAEFGKLGTILHFGLPTVLGVGEAYRESIEEGADPVTAIRNGVMMALSGLAMEKLIVPMAPAVLRGAGTAVKTMTAPLGVSAIQASPTLRSILPSFLGQGSDQRAVSAARRMAH